MSPVAVSLIAFITVIAAATGIYGLTRFLHRSEPPR
jgi:hypothetical protein